MAGVKKKHRLGLVGYADIAKRIQRTGSTSANLSKALDWNERRMSMNLRFWHRMGIVHVIGWKSPSHGRARCEIWKFGPGVSAPRPEGLTRELIRPHTMLSLAHSFGMIVRELIDGATCEEICESVGITRRIVVTLLSEMHAIRLIYVESWHRRQLGGEPYPSYRLGRREDAERPPPIGNAAAARKWRAGKKWRVIQSAANSLAQPSNSG